MLGNLSRSKGVTLIEMLLVVAIIGILAAIVYPSYNEFVLRGNRTEGQRELLRLANLQEQFFVDSRAYTTDMTALGQNADPFITINGLYSIDATVAGDTFILTATARLTQVADTACATLTINEVGARTPVNNCWEN